MVGADGTASFVRGALGIEVFNVDYAQTCFVTTVTCERSADGCAYERFTATGPVALLPLGGQRMGVVLTVPADDAARVAALDDAGFIELLHERFGWRLGRTSRASGQRVFRIRCKPRAGGTPRAHRARVLVGNAAQTLHPIGAQGFNLGLRDALTLAELLIEAAYQGDDPGAAELLDNYCAQREEDRSGTIAMSDGLARWTQQASLCHSNCCVRWAWSTRSHRSAAGHAGAARDGFPWSRATAGIGQSLMNYRKT